MPSKDGHNNYSKMAVCKVDIPATSLETTVLADANAKKMIAERIAVWYFMVGA